STVHGNADQTRNTRFRVVGSDGHCLAVGRPSHSSETARDCTGGNGLFIAAVKIRNHYKSLLGLRVDADKSRSFIVGREDKSIEPLHHLSRIAAERGHYIEKTGLIFIRVFDKVIDVIAVVRERQTPERDVIFGKELKFAARRDLFDAYSDPLVRTGYVRHTFS